MPELGAWLAYFTGLAVIGPDSWYDCTQHALTEYTEIVWWLDMTEFGVIRLDMSGLDWTDAAHLSNVKVVNILTVTVSEWLVWLIWAKFGE
jgi:hypothetical protein